MSSPLHVQTRNDVILIYAILTFLITSYCRHADVTVITTYIIMYKSTLLYTNVKLEDHMALVQSRGNFSGRKFSNLHL